MLSRTKGLFILVLAAMMVLTACAGGNAGNTNNSGAENQGSANGGADAGEKVTITWWDTMTSEASNTALAKIIADYEAEHPNVDIERTFVSFGDIKNKLLLGSVGDSGPDIVWIDSPDHHAFAAAGILADITEEVEAWGQADQYFEGPWSSTVYEGKNYGVPVGSNSLALYYNTDMLAEAGIEPPTNWEELKEAAKALTNDDVYGFAVSAVKTEEGTFNFLPFLWQSGSDIREFNSEGRVKEAEVYQYMASNGYMSKEVVNQKQSDNAAQFAAGKIAMMVNGTWQIPFLQKEAKVNWDIVELPADVQGGTVLGGENWAITSSSKHKDIAFDIIAFANEKDRAVEFLKTNGRLPSRTDYIQDPFWQEDPQMKIFADSMEVAKARAYGPNYPKISEAIQIMIQEVIGGAKAPAEAVKDADAKIQQQL